MHIERRKHDRRLSEKQVRIVSLLAQGYLQKQITEIVNLSLQGIKWHVNEAKKKLRAKTTEHLIFLASPYIRQTVTKEDLEA